MTTDFGRQMLPEEIEKLAKMIERGATTLARSGRISEHTYFEIDTDCENAAAAAATKTEQAQTWVRRAYDRLVTA